MKKLITKILLLSTLLFGVISCNNNNNTAFDPFDPKNSDSKNFDSISLESKSTEEGIKLTLRMLPTDIVVEGWINFIERNSGIETDTDTGIKFEGMDIDGFNENKEITLLFPYTKRGEEYKFRVQCFIENVVSGDKRYIDKVFSPITAKYTTPYSIDLSSVKNSEITPTFSPMPVWCNCNGDETVEGYELKVEAPGYDDFVSSCGKTAWLKFVFCKGYVDYTGPNYFYWWPKNPHSPANNIMYLFEGQEHYNDESWEYKEYNDITDLKNNYKAKDDENASVWGALVIAYWNENGQEFSYQRESGVQKINWN